MLALALMTLLGFSGTEFPLDEEIKGNLGNDVYRVEFTCKVSKVGENYTYLYSIKNKGKEPVKVKWEILNKALQNGTNNDIFLELTPNENINFALEHPEPPFQIFGAASIFRTTDAEEYGKEIKSFPYFPKDVKVTMPKGKITTLLVIGNTSAALPKTYAGVR